MFLAEGEDENKAEDLKYSIAYKIIFYFMIIVTLLGIVAGIMSIFLISSWSSDFTNQLLVLTAHRTRDLQEPNTFSMYSVEGDDPSTRLFVCMMQSGIGKKECSAPKSPFSFRSCLMGLNKDCLSSADWNWPIDYGFQQCVVRTFNPTTRQINGLVECMRHTDGIQGVSVETQNSMRFLGSYNYVSLLIASFCAMVSFLIFTAGGIYDGSRLKTEKKYGYHIFNWYEPLAAPNILFAFIWTLVCLAVSYIYMFPFTCEGCKIDLQQKQAYPTTPWTGIVSAGLFFVLLIYYGWFLVEVISAWYNNRDVYNGNALKLVNKTDESDEQSMREDVDSVEESQRAPLPGGRRPPSEPVVTGGLVYGPPRNTSQPSGPPPNPAVFSMRPPQGYVLNPGAGGSLPPGYGPQSLPGTWGPESIVMPGNPTRRLPGSFTVPRQPRSRSFGPSNNRGMANAFFLNRLGVRLTGEESEEGHEVSELIPVLIPIFASMLIFVDGPLFVGMITPQHSPLQESVAFIFIGIILARTAQVVAYKFMGGAFFSKEEVESTEEPNVFKLRRDDPKQFALRVIVLFTYLSSLLILFIPLYHMMISIDYLNALKEVGGNSHLVQIFFLIIVAICPEVVRSAIIFLMWVRYLVSARYKLIAFQILFAWEWISRIVFVCIALFGVPPHLVDSSKSIFTHLAIA